MLPSPIVSSGSILALWFTTDFAVSAQGFKAVYEGKTMCECAQWCMNDGHETDNWGKSDDRFELQRDWTMWENGYEY